MDNHSFDVLFGSKNTSYPQLVNSLHFGYTHSNWIVHLNLAETLDCFTNLVFSLSIVLPSLTIPSSVLIRWIIIQLLIVLFLFILFSWCFKLYHIDRYVLPYILHSQLFQWVIIHFMPLLFVEVVNFLQKFVFFCQMAFIMTFLAKYSSSISIIMLLVSFHSFLFLLIITLFFI